jgi:hypothetical protein
MEALLNQKSIPEHTCILKLCATINSHQLTPKKFFLALVLKARHPWIDKNKKEEGLHSIWSCPKWDNDENSILHVNDASWAVC